MYIEGQLRTNNYDKSVGSGRVTIANPEVVAAQIERGTSNNTEAD